MGSEEVVLSNSTANSVTIGLGIQHPNGLYHCLTAQSQREYFSLFLNNSGKRLLYAVTGITQYLRTTGSKLALYHETCASIGYDCTTILYI